MSRSNWFEKFKWNSDIFTSLEQYHTWLEQPLTKTLILLPLLTFSSVDRDSASKLSGEIQTILCCEMSPSTRLINWFLWAQFYRTLQDLSICACWFCMGDSQGSKMFEWVFLLESVDLRTGFYNFKGTKMVGWILWKYLYVLEDKKVTS